MSATHVEITGVQEITRAFKVGPKKALLLSRAANHFVASQAVKAMRAFAPRGSGLNSPLLKKSIKAKKLRQRRDSSASNVIIMLGTSRKARDGAWYWHFVDRGTKTGNIPQPGHDFTGRAHRQVAPKAPELYRKKVADAAAKYVQREAAKGRR